MLGGDFFRRYTSKDDCRVGVDGGGDGDGRSGGHRCSFNRQQAHYHCAARDCDCAFPNLIEMRAHGSQHRSMTATAAAVATTTMTTTTAAAGAQAPPPPPAVGECLRLLPPHCTKDSRNDDDGDEDDRDDREDRDDRDYREDGGEADKDTAAAVAAGGLVAPTHVHCSRENCQFTSKGKSDLAKHRAHRRKCGPQFARAVDSSNMSAPPSVSPSPSNGEDVVASDGDGAVALLSHARDWGLGLGLAEQRLRQALAASAAEEGDADGEEPLYVGGYGQMLAATQAAAAAALLGAGTPSEPAIGGKGSGNGNGAPDASDCDSSDASAQWPLFGTTAEYLQDMLQQHRQMLHHHHHQQLLLHQRQPQQQHEATTTTTTTTTTAATAADESSAPEYGMSASLGHFAGLKPAPTPTSATAHSVQITSIDGFFNRKRGRPPKNRFVEVYKNTQQSPQAIFTSFKLEKQGGCGNAAVLTTAAPENIARVPTTSTPSAGVNVLEAQRLFLRSLAVEGDCGGDDLPPAYNSSSCSGTRAGSSQSEQPSSAGNSAALDPFRANVQRMLLGQGGSTERSLDVDCGIDECRLRHVQPHLHCRRCRQQVSPFEVDAHTCRQQLPTGSVGETFPAQRPSTAGGTWIRVAALGGSDDGCGEPSAKKAKRLSVVRAAGTFYPENSSCSGVSAAAVVPGQSQPPTPPCTPTVAARMYGGTPARRRRTQPQAQTPTQRQRQHSLLQRTMAGHDDAAAVDEMPQDLSIHAAVRQQQQHQQQQEQSQQALVENQRIAMMGTTSGGCDNHTEDDDDRDRDHAASLLGVHMKDVFEFYRERLHQQLQQTLQRHQQHLVASRVSEASVPLYMSAATHPPPPQELASVLNVASAFIEAATASAVAASVAAAANVTVTGSGSSEKHHSQPLAATSTSGAAVTATPMASGTAPKLKDERVPTGYLKFRFNEDCCFPRCGYRNRQSHFHCNRVDCHYSFCDKTRFVQHTARHERLATLMGDDFQQFRANMTCGYANCPYAAAAAAAAAASASQDVAEMAAAASSSASPSGATAAASASASKKSSHFHCLKCAFICADTNKVVAHRRLHSKMEYIRMAGFRKVSSSENCASTTAGELCSYSLKHTHYHCLVCDCSVLSRAQLASHRHRPTTTAATTAAAATAPAGGRAGLKVPTTSTCEATPMATPTR